MAIQALVDQEAPVGGPTGLVVPGGGRWQWFVPLDADHRPIRRPSTVAGQAPEADPATDDPVR